MSRTPYTVALVCLGNICRSPMAHVVLERRVAEAGLDDRVRVVSAGTAEWHVGKAMDPRAAATLTGAGYDASRHRARQIHDAWFTGEGDEGDEHVDLALVMDEANRADVVALAGSHADRVRMFRELDPEGPGEVPDPYYGGDEGFTEVLAMVERCAQAWVTEIARTLTEQHE